MPVFRPEKNHIRVDTIHSSRHKQNEVDHDLYFDADTFTFFVVESREFVSGPNVSVGHFVRSLDNYLGEHPERKVKIAEVIAARIAYRIQPTTK